MIFNRHSDEMGTIEHSKGIRILMQQGGEK